MIGVVTLASGRTALIRAATRSSPITIAAEVQPNATTSSGTPGMMTEAASASRPSIAASVSGVIRASFRIRLSYSPTPGTSARMRRHSCSIVWSVASTISPSRARGAMPASSVKGRRGRGAVTPSDVRVLSVRVVIVAPVSAASCCARRAPASGPRSGRR